MQSSIAGRLPGQLFNLGLFVLGSLIVGSACSPSSGSNDNNGPGPGPGTTTGAPTGTTGTTTGGTGGTGTTTGTSTGTTVPPVDGACGFTGGYTGPDLGRCAEGKDVAGGGYLTIDHFDDMNENIVASRDGRTGNWWAVNHASVTASMTFEATPAGGSVDSVGAAHHVSSAGTADAWASTMGVDIAECYDARAYEGLSFWLRGEPGAGHTQVKLSIHSPPTQPAENGGACTENCFDHFAVMVPITANWTQHVVPWSSFGRLDCLDPTPAIPEGFEPHAQIVGLSFSQPDATAGIDYWVDDLRFLKGSPAATATFRDFVTEEIFNELFPSGARDARFTYEGLIQAVTNCVDGAWPVCSNFTNEGDLATRMHEAAAFLAHVMHETGTLRLMEEEACSDGSCSYGRYYGRGALQLTHDFNYGPAGTAFGIDLLGNPDLVASDPSLAWGTALWFWSTEQSSKGICHNAIVSGNFGATTSIINGIDCGTDKSDSRISHYRVIAHALGINPRTVNLNCSG